MDDERKSQHVISRREALGYLTMFLLGGATGGALDAWYRDQANVPQGYWGDVHVQNGKLHAEVTAYMLDPHGVIDFVNVTLKTPKGDWVSVCRLDQASVSNTYICDQDLSQYLTHGQSTQISFDVYSGNRRTQSPNGPKTITMQ